ncbi:type I DNA topoisomerase [Candidatus Marinamargulisbacteria bacterium SCGC AAA071-K20]|nr:type I DNA topoisomerase [Candidatus Marinamargulisbacteria bacterium SCGC AAA071-K20]
MSKKLVIVESPAKIKTISKFLGSDYVLAASFGHIRDLPGKKLGIDVENNFEPEYTIMDDKTKVIKELKSKLKDIDEVYLATDPDREGEAIAWHLVQALKLPEKQTKRIVFNEITKTAIQEAIQQPREINIDLVDAQQARRLLDRIVGFEISPILWRKVKTGLSAGRVQSVSVRLIVEREREIIKFKPNNFFKVVAEFNSSDGSTFSADLSSRLDSYEDAKALLEKCIDNEFSVKSIEKKPTSKSPSTPFTTSSLQQEASRKCGFSVSQTMSVAQKLYEAGLITYMRTDSISLSKEALSTIGSYIKKEYGEEYHELKTYESKIKGAQEAHEAIRPTNVAQLYTGEDHYEERLYELIRKRSIACQMSKARLDRTVITIKSKTDDITFNAKGEVITFEGFLKVYRESVEDDDEPSDSDQGLLPKMTEGEVLDYDNITATERFTRHLPRYSEASLVKKMEELGIGRPSTYAPTISTIQKRQYVEKGEKDGKVREFKELVLESKTITENQKEEVTGKEKGKLCPTDIGSVVNDFLVASFKDILDYHFTAKIEKEFDVIADGKKKWQDMLASFYSDFQPCIEIAKESDRQAGERKLGIDPETKRPVSVRIGRYGPIAQIGESDDEEKQKFASLQKNQNLETITLEETLELFQYPKHIGEYEGHPVEAAIGRYGPYIKHDSKYFNLKELSVDEITLEQAIVLIDEKREADKNKFIKEFTDQDPPVLIQNGPYGPYIKVAKKNVKIPKDTEPKDLTYEDCIALYEEAKKAPKRKPKKKAKK